MHTCTIHTHSQQVHTHTERQQQNAFITQAVTVMHTVNQSYRYIHHKQHAHIKNTPYTICMQHTRKNQHNEKKIETQKNMITIIFQSKTIFQPASQKQWKTCSYTHHEHAHTNSIQLVQHSRKAHATNRTNNKYKSKRKEKKRIQTCSAENHFFNRNQTIFQPACKSNAKHAATLTINMRTPITYIRTPRTYTLYNMHVKPTRQTKRKQIKYKLKGGKIQTYLVEKKFSAEDNISVSM